MSELPDRPDLDQLRRQARELQRAAADGEPHALARLRAVSEHVSLSAAQLAVAREYGFSSWPSLRTEAEYRRRMSAARAADRAGGQRAEDRRSFGGATAVETAAGTVHPRALLIGPGHAVLDASLSPARDATLFSRLPAHAGIPRFDDVVVTDDRGTRYSLSFDSGSTFQAEPGQAPEPAEVSLRLDPVPAPMCGWLELRGRDGAATRLVPSARPQVRVGTVAPASERESARGAESHMDMHAAAQRTDGPRQHLSLATDLPSVNGIEVQLDSLVSEPGAWRLYLRARPSWWDSGPDRHPTGEALSVHAADDLGGTYLSIFDGSTFDHGYEELTLRFNPRLDPLAQSLKLTFAGPDDQVTAEVRLPLGFARPGRRRPRRPGTQRK